jgi:hypothetical protein
MNVYLANHDVGARLADPDTLRFACYSTLFG